MVAEQSFILKSGDVDIAVNVYGQAQAQTLILVHGYPDSSAVWNRMLPALCQRFRVVTYDVRGAGLSTAPQRKQDYTLSSLAADFRAVLDAVSPAAAVHVMAHDWGSIQTWESVANPALQSRIASYTSVSGPCLDHIGYWIRSTLQTRTAAGLAAVGGQILHSWYVWLFQLPVLAPTLWKTVLGKYWHQSLARSQGVHADPSSTQLRDGLNGIELYRANIRRVATPLPRSTQVPVQLIVPVLDDFVTPALARDSVRPWAKNLWSRDVSATHWVPLSHPELLADMLIEFAGFVDGAPESAALKAARVTAPPLAPVTVPVVRTRQAQQFPRQQQY